MWNDRSLYCLWASNPNFNNVHLSYMFLMVWNILNLPWTKSKGLLSVMNFLLSTDCYFCSIVLKKLYMRIGDILLLFTTCNTFWRFLLANIEIKTLPWYILYAIYWGVLGSCLKFTTNFNFLTREFDLIDKICNC